MKEGTVAMIDALGFRGIWDRWPPDQVLTNMHAMKGYCRGPPGSCRSLA